MKIINTKNMSNDELLQEYTDLYTEWYGGNGDISLKTQLFTIRFELNERNLYDKKNDIESRI